jgi:hypothetical protein
MGERPFLGISLCPFESGGPRERLTREGRLASRVTTSSRQGSSIELQDRITLVTGLKATGLIKIAAPEESMTDTVFIYTKAALGGVGLSFLTLLTYFIVSSRMIWNMLHQVQTTTRSIRPLTIHNPLFWSVGIMSFVLGFFLVISSSRP